MPATSESTTNRRKQECIVHSHSRRVYTCKSTDRDPLRRQTIFRDDLDPVSFSTRTLCGHTMSFRGIDIPFIGNFK